MIIETFLTSHPPFVIMLDRGGADGEGARGHSVECLVTFLASEHNLFNTPVFLIYSIY